MPDDVDGERGQLVACVLGPADVLADGCAGPVAQVDAFLQPWRGEGGTLSGGRCVSAGQGGDPVGEGRSLRWSAIRSKRVHSRPMEPSRSPHRSMRTMRSARADSRSRYVAWADSSGRVRIASASASLACRCQVLMRAATSVGWNRIVRIHSANAVPSTAATRRLTVGAAAVVRLSATTVGPPWLPGLADWLVAVPVPALRSANAR